MNNIRLLGIETSCDETAICLIEVDEKNQSLKILGNTVHSQINEHIPYGGVFPMLAKREHEKNLPTVFEKTMKEAGVKPGDVDFIAVTIGPGLEPALWTGITFARDLAKKWNVPIIPCNHMEGHILTSLIKKKGDVYEFIKPPLPSLSLLISGGHTQIVLMEGIGKYKIVGETHDDAIGECFDKIARTLGLEYPGGPKISELATEARKENISSPEALPRPMISSKDLDFSFSGLKTAVLYLVKKLKENNLFDKNTIKSISREVEDAVTEVVIEKMKKAIEEYAVESLIIGGGVIANTHLRENLAKLANDSSISLLLPQIDHSTDNALMIALAGYWSKEKAVSCEVELKALGTLPLGSRKN